MLGQGVSADEASLALRGLETLAVRLERIERTTLTLLDFVTDQPGVREVRHPALTHNPGHAEWLRDFSGSTGLLTLFLEPWTRPLLAKAIEAMDQFAIGASWGGTKSVVAVLDALPPRTVTQVSHDGPLVRFSIGLEHSDDLIESLTKGFAILAAAQPAPSITN